MATTLDESLSELQDGAPVQEGDQVSTLEPIDETSQSDVPDVLIINPATEQTPEVNTAEEKEDGISGKEVTEGQDMESETGDDSSKVEVTFETGNLSKSASDVKSALEISGVSCESQSTARNVFSDMTKVVSEVGQAQTDEDQAEVNSKQVQDDQTGSGMVGKESPDMKVDPAATVSVAPAAPAAPEQDAADQQQEKQLKEQQQQQQQEEIKELVFDPNKPVGRCSLIPPVFFAFLFLFI